MSDQRSERQLQLDYHRAADLAHVAWQTRGPYFAATEAHLLQSIHLDAGERLLEIGCGEGANLHHLRGLKGTRFGIDFSKQKSRAARSTGAFVACADATRLPFAEASFDVVLIRDLLHHVPTRLDVLTEAHRVLRPGGRLHVIEANGRAPLALLQAIIIRAERGLLKSTSRRLRDELEATGFRHIEFIAEQPFPLERLVLHPKIGFPQLGRLAIVREALDAFHQAAERVIPQLAWLYLCFSATKVD